MANQASRTPQGRAVLEKRAAEGNRYAEEVVGINYGRMERGRLEKLASEGDEMAGEEFERRYGYRIRVKNMERVEDTAERNVEDTVDCQIEKGSFIDERDGQEYRTVKMPDGKVWMARNLNYKIDNSWCYDNDESNGEKYGRLYTWDAAKAACPAGWHLPSHQEWEELKAALGCSWKEGHVLKATSGWRSGGNGTDSHGFSALPGGWRKPKGSFGDVWHWGYWWTATDGSGGRAYCQYIDWGRDSLVDDRKDKDFGLSVRCVKDAS